VTARGPQADRGRAEFAGWMEARGHTHTGTEYDWDDMADAFAGGMHKLALEPTAALCLSAIARLSEGLREVQRACERNDAPYAITPVAAAALADAERLQLPAPEPPLEVPAGGGIVMRPDSGEALIIAFAADVPPERVAEVSHNLHHASGLRVIAVADVAAVKGWQPDAEPPAPELSEAARLAQDALSDITRMCASSDSDVGLRDIGARALAGLGLLDAPEPKADPELRRRLAEFAGGLDRMSAKGSRSAVSLAKRNIAAMIRDLLDGAH
jgi:hypothetical protein